MTGYNSGFTKVDGEPINAADHADEFTNLQQAFDENVGHTHDGTDGEGGTVHGVNVEYDDSLSGHGVSTVQHAIDVNHVNIGTLAADIATNTTDIATNTGNIATNTGNIATNTGDIATNAIAITGKKDDFTENNGFNLFKADNTQALAGISNDLIMSPLRVREVIEDGSFDPQPKVSTVITADTPLITEWVGAGFEFPWVSVAEANTTCTKAGWWRYQAHVIVLGEPANTATIFRLTCDGANDVRIVSMNATFGAGGIVAESGFTNSEVSDNINDSLIINDPDFTDGSACTLNGLVYSSSASFTVGLDMLNFVFSSNGCKIKGGSYISLEWLSS